MRKRNGFSRAWLELRRVAAFIFLNAAHKCQPKTDEDPKTLRAFIWLYQAMIDDAIDQAQARRAERENENG